MNSTAWKWARLLLGAGLVALVATRVGTGPFLDGLRRATPAAVAAALVITAITTLCSAWRWRLVAEGLGVPVPARRAFAAYYRSQLLNATLPGGIVGDVDRGVGHGRAAGRLGRGLGSVASERALGQGVQIALTALLVVLVPSPLRPGPATGAAVLAGLVVAAAVAVLLVPREVLGGGRWLLVALVSAVAAAGHVTIFLVAVAASGTAPARPSLLPVAGLVLVAAALPVNVAGWGPREGAAAAVFAAAGMTAADGVTASVTYGVLGFVATLPGLVVLAPRWTPRWGPQWAQRWAPRWAPRWAQKRGWVPENRKEVVRA
ncbi:lysylphosphatidylglycerol synthase transmembrane domain-containing protein [Marmoricola sp. RAF53]|uniref:lysylphosphatidylglycerol synthase transmembrane domain-containing protein n=1 Tax=Marmoricola sp. RAF53 TaxID=3233059 RepID=UPI003F96935D